MTVTTCIAAGRYECYNIWKHTNILPYCTKSWQKYAANLTFSVYNFCSSLPRPLVGYPSPCFSTLVPAAPQPYHQCTLPIIHLDLPLTDWWCSWVVFLCPVFFGQSILIDCPWLKPKTLIQKLGFVQPHCQHRVASGKYYDFSPQEQTGWRQHKPEFIVCDCFAIKKQKCFSTMEVIYRLQHGPQWYLWVS